MVNPRAKYLKMFVSECCISHVYLSIPFPSLKRVLFKPEIVALVYNCKLLFLGQITNTLVAKTSR